MNFNMKVCPPRDNAKQGHLITQWINLNKRTVIDWLIKQLFKIYIQEEFEDTKGVFRIRKSKKDRQHNDEKKKCKKTNNDLQNIHI